MESQAEMSAATGGKFHLAGPSEGSTTAIEGAGAEQSSGSSPTRRARFDNAERSLSPERTGIKNGAGSSSHSRSRSGRSLNTRDDGTVTVTVAEDSEELPPRTVAIKPDGADDHQGHGKGQRNKSTWGLIALTIAMGGSQIAWVVELGYGTPYLLSLGLSEQLTSLVWLAGPSKYTSSVSPIADI